MPEQAAAVILVGELHAAEMTAVHVADAVVPGQPLVEEAVMGREQLGDAVIPAHLIVEELLGLGDERGTQVVVPVREGVGVGLRQLDVPQEQPLRREVRDEGPGPLVGDHPAHLLIEDRRLLQLALLGQLQQLVVGHAAPEEERQPRREREIVDAVRPSPGATFSGSRSTRKRNSGSTSIRSSAAWTAPSNVRSARALR